MKSTRSAKPKASKPRLEKTRGVSAGGHRAKTFAATIPIQEVYFRELFENSPEGIVALDKGGNIMHANAAFLKLFGFSIQEILGRQLNDLIVPDSLAEEGEDLSNRVLKNERIEAETLRKRKD